MKTQVLKLKPCTHGNSDGHCGMLIYKGQEVTHIVAYDTSIGFYGRSPYTVPTKDSLDYVTNLSTKKEESK